ncbi:XRE family transcriptional regulator [uncultured Georgenia sp.]|uniref:helix-turn-helix domain-containing protein n=1 Tax=uncultured Georgenia sp. TaxID=378209 RepID=UPI0026067A58|nr:XRE family transcriptional regulator [uncultured Georgenia sp.]HLV05289.1 XRE family transcriptional regulator [Actinomycetaceae bacterium]
METDLGQVGRRLRAARQARGWTLTELAHAAGMSPSTLSRLESGKRQAGLELIVPLTRRLGIRIDDLVAPRRPDPRVRRGVIHRDGLVIVPLAPEDSPVQTYRITYPPRRELPPLRVHEGFEWFYVLTGRVRLRLGEDDVVVERGEAAEFDTAVPHAMSAVGTRPAETISIFDASGARIHTYGAGG